MGYKCGRALLNRKLTFKLQRTANEYAHNVRSVEDLIRKNYTKEDTLNSANRYRITIRNTCEGKTTQRQTSEGQPDL